MTARWSRRFHPDVLGMIDDFWFRYVTDIGLVGPDKGKGGKFLLLPPGYQAKVPEGYFVVRIPTYESILVWRNLPVKGDLTPAIENLKKFTRIYPLSKAANPPANTFVDVSGKDFSTVAPADYKFWDSLSQVVQRGTRRVSRSGHPRLLCFHRHREG